MSRFVFSLIIISFFGIVHNNIKKCSPNILQNHLQKMEAKQDVTTAPCDDFFTYACGNWEATYQLRKLGARDTLTSVKAENKLILINHFNEAYDSHSTNSTRKCLWDFYNSCINANSSLEVYTHVLRQYSDWPISNSKFHDAKMNESFNWEHISAELRRYGVNTFWRTLIQPNWQNSEQLIFYVVPPSFDLLRKRRRRRSRKYRNNNDDDEVFLYKTYVKYLLLNMGVRVRKALLYAEEIVGFEQELMSLTTAEGNSVVLQAPKTLESLASEFPELKIQKFFDILLQDIMLPENYERKLLIVADSVYLQSLWRLLKKTEIDTIGMYLLVQFLVHFEVTLHDDQMFVERQEHCLEQANSFFPKELSRLYLDLKHNENGMEFLESAQQHLNEIFDSLKRVFESLINDTHVFDHSADTRIDGLEKLYAMRLRLPELTLKNDSENECLENMSTNYDANLLRLSKLKAFQGLLAINKSLSHFEMDDMLAYTNYGPLDVNAYYRLKKNAIEIPVGLLSLPFYDNCLEAAMIYGTVAFIVGHELLHGFDYDGLNYDKIGNIANDGWDPKSIIAYGTKASCYLGARYDNAHTNINENIADSEGLRLALGAFEKLSESPLQSDKLELFFTSFAQIWCNAFNEYTERHRLHAVSRERVNNALGNFQAFAETFHCKPGSTMNPVEKCRIW